MKGWERSDSTTLRVSRTMRGISGMTIAAITTARPGRVSVISANGGPFNDQHADAALFNAIETGLRPGIACTSVDCTINDPAFARACVEALLAHMRSVSPTT
jgi:uncharacterized protein (UPF0261 family)